MNGPALPRDHAVWADGRTGGSIVAVFLCDDQARVCAQSASAMALLDAGWTLTLEAGVLAASTGALDMGEAIRQVAAGAQARQTLLVPVVSGPALVLDIVRVVMDAGQGGASAQVVVTVRGAAPDEASQAAVLQASFDLTAAEAAIAIRLARGETRDAIAAGRGVSPGTLKSQIRSIYQKVGVTREVELAACLASLI